MSFLRSHIFASHLANRVASVGATNKILSMPTAGLTTLRCLRTTINQPLSLSTTDILCRTFTSSLVFKNSTSSEVALDLPSNLIVADPSVLRPLPVPKVKVEDYLFPQLFVEESMEVKSFSTNVTATGTTALEQKMFEVPIRKDIVLNLIRYIRNARRQPKKTKRMSEIRGSNKKPRPQKGTGVGQVGHRRNSAWRGGQKAHGPVIRDYSISLNKKVRALGMMMTVVAKYREGNLHVFENFELPNHRTKELKTILTAHGLADAMTVFVDEELNENFKLASNNLPKANAIELRFLDAYEVVKKEKLAMTVPAFQELQKKLLFEYTQGGKRKAMQRRAEEYAEIVKKGAEIKKSVTSTA